MSFRPGRPVCINGVGDPDEITNLFRDNFFVRSLFGSAVGQMCDTETDFTDGLQLKITAKDVAQAIA